MHCLTLWNSLNSDRSINPRSKLGNSILSLSTESSCNFSQPDIHSDREICAGLDFAPSLYRRTRIRISSMGSIPRCSASLEMPSNMILKWKFAIAMEIADKRLVWSCCSWYIYIWILTVTYLPWWQYCCRLRQQFRQTLQSHSLHRPA
jgi:hypothetical protein